MFYECKGLKFYSVFINEVIFVFLGFVLHGAEGIKCPVECFCPEVTQNVYCSRKNLPFIPNGIPADTIQLNLNDNNFQNPVLVRSNFSGYTRLEHLYLSGCGIEYITLDTFADLSRLKWLDISKNRLKIIDDYTFRGLSLQHLFLNDNPGMQLTKNAFANLRTTGLYLHNCAISNITLDIIRPLNGTLKSFWCDGNKFEQFDIEWLYFFRTLIHIRLGDNPLHCNCEIKWLFDFYQNHHKKFSGVEAPSCRTPVSLRGKLFETLNKDDFKCQLPVFKNVDLIFEASVGKLTCLAIGDPIPTIFWIKPDKSAEKFYPKKLSLNKENQGIMYVTNPQAVDKAKYQCVASNPAGNVTLSLNVIWPPVYSRDVGIPDTHPPKEKVTKPVFVQSSPDEKKDVIQKEKDSEYVIEANNNVNSEISMKKQVSTPQQPEFTMVDIIGAVVGTFLLTLLACVVIFHVFYRHHERMHYREQTSVNEKQNVNNHVMAEIRSEHSKMLQNNHRDGMI